MPPTIQIPPKFFNQKKAVSQPEPSRFICSALDPWQRRVHRTSSRIPAGTRWASDHIWPAREFVPASSQGDDWPTFPVFKWVIDEEHNVYIYILYILYRYLNMYIYIYLNKKYTHRNRNIGFTWFTPVTGMPSGLTKDHLKNLGRSLELK
jgi:hypothetical protein